MIIIFSKVSVGEQESNCRGVGYVKTGIHPEYGHVGFRDIATGRVFVTRSTLVSRNDLPRQVIDGIEMPVVDVEISSDSHPLWTGQTRVIDTEGRVEAFRRRYGGVK